MDNEFRLNTNSFPNELRMLLLFIRSDIDPIALNRFKSMSSEIDWDYFLQLARHHRVHPLVYTNMKSWNVEFIPEHVERALYADYFQNTLQMFRLSAEINHICIILEKHNICSLVLKGPVLAESLYGDISLRTSKDLDILIPVDHVEEAEKLLIDTGYKLKSNLPRVFNDWKRKAHHLSYSHPEKKFQIELHWRLNPDMGNEPSFQELWERRQSGSLSNCSIHYLGQEDLFFYLVCHGARHGWFRLRWLTDIDRILRLPLEWEKTSLLFKQYDSYQLGGQAIILSSHLLGTPVVDMANVMTLNKNMLQLSQKTIVFIEDIAELCPRPAPHLAKFYKRYLFSLKTNRQKIKFIISRFYPNSWDAAEFPLPKYLHFLYFPLRPFFWFLRRLKRI